MLVWRAVWAAAMGFDGIKASCTSQGTLRGFDIVTHWSLGAVWCAGEDGCGGFKYVKRKAEKQGMGLKPPCNRDAFLSYVVVIITPPNNTRLSPSLGAAPACLI